MVNQYLEGMLDELALFNAYAFSQERTMAEINELENDNPPSTLDRLLRGAGFFSAGAVEGAIAVNATMDAFFGENYWPAIAYWTLKAATNAGSYLMYNAIGEEIERILR